ncbi:MAG: exodeoxyribonuclease VII large subunit [Melioribacteraceae bacterium]|nr:exodeoxyribonuclease VII large subunit [Melioribacteraceae bacterium]
MSELLTVSELTNSIKKSLEENFGSISLIGEISNFKAHVSGHWYFSLKDSGAQINCTMWKGINNYVFFTPQDGMKVTVTGKISIYPPRGTYQLDVKSMKPAGIGELQAAFEKLKSELHEEGLFNKEYKKSIPRFPNKIGIVTAIGGAALRDMISVAKRRYPVCELLIMPSKVQGEGSAREVADGIRELNTYDDIDVIIVGRGGGSLEDLWAFNEEAVARAIFDSEIPVISGVGHEVDFTIADFVADLRAPTPSAAMELATPNIDEIFAFINDFSYNSKLNIDSKLNDNFDRLNNVLNSYGFRNPKNQIRNKQQLLDNLIYRIQNSEDKLIERKKNKIEILQKSIEANNVNAILKKGFTIIKQNGKFIKRSSEFNKNEKAEIKFYDKEIEINND